MQKDAPAVRRSYRPGEIVGTSTTSFSDATDHAIACAFEQHPDLDWYDVEQLSGTFLDGEIQEWCVRLSVGRAGDPRGPMNDREPG